MLLANFKRVGGKRRRALSRTKQTQCDFGTNMNFFWPKPKTWLLLGLYWSQFLFLPINMSVYAKM